MDKITFGMKGARVFPVTGETDGFPTYGTAVDWKGARESSYSPVGEDTVIYADDIEYHVIAGTKSIEGTFTMLTMPEDLKVKALGYVKDTKGAYAVGAGTKQNVGIIFESTVVDDTGVEDRELHVLYRVSLSTPEEANKTKEGTAEAKEFSVPFKALQVTQSDKTFSEFILRKSEVSDTVYSAALTAMYVPTFSVTP